MLGVIYEKQHNEEGNTAIIYKDQKISYFDLNKSIIAFACILKNKGVEPGDKIVIALPNCPEFIYAVFGAWKLGVTVVPLDYRLKAHEYSTIFEEVKPKLIVTSKDVYGISPLQVIETSLESVKPLSSTDVLTRESDLVNLDMIQAESLLPNKNYENNEMGFIAMIQYTSGTMGRAKGILKYAKAFVLEAQKFSERMKYTSEDVILTVAPLYHAFAFGDALISGLYAGASLVLEESFTGRYQLETIEKYGVTVFPGVPFMFGLINKLQNAENYNLKSLRKCFSAGAPLPEDVTREFEKKFKILISSLYGSSETNTICVNTDIEQNRCYNSVGTSIEGVEIFIKDDDGNSLPAGETGDIWIKSKIAGIGYLDRPELNNECFKNDSVITGDVGYMDSNGLLYITGRKKNFINVGGEKVDPSEVEMIIKKHPKVKECVVVGSYDAMGGQIVKAVIVPVIKNDINRKEVINHCKSQLAPYKVPRIVEFIDEIPVSSTGKILRRLLV